MNKTPHSKRCIKVAFLAAVNLESVTVRSHIEPHTYRFVHRAIVCHIPKRVVSIARSLTHITPKRLPFIIKLTKRFVTRVLKLDRFPQWSNIAVCFSLVGGLKYSSNQPHLQRLNTVSSFSNWSYSFGDVSVEFEGFFYKHCCNFFWNSKIHKHQLYFERLNNFSVM